MFERKYKPVERANQSSACIRSYHSICERRSKIRLFRVEADHPEMRYGMGSEAKCSQLSCAKALRAIILRFSCNAERIYLVLQQTNSILLGGRHGHLRRGRTSLSMAAPGYVSGRTSPSQRWVMRLQGCVRRLAELKNEVA
jgi:hypothetical protein